MIEGSGSTQHLGGFQVVKGKGIPLGKKALYVPSPLHLNMKAEALRQGVTLEVLTGSVLACFLEHGMSKTCSNDVLNTDSQPDG